jgi:threonine/homoserine/homoserine lactone efflux protein
MAAFQWVNPKGWLVGVAVAVAVAVAAFLDRRSGGALAPASIFATVFALVALLACMPWLGFGAALQRVLQTPRARRVVSTVMAALLAASAIPLVSAHF